MLGVKSRSVLYPFAAYLAFIPLAIPAHSESVTDKIKQLQREQLTVTHQASVERRESKNQKYQQRNLFQYQDKNGAMTFTNKPEKYENNKRYERIEIAYKQISVPKQYQKPAKSAAPVIYTSDSVRELVQLYAKDYSLDPNLLFALIKCESNFQTDAVSPAGACGLMQLMPGTAAEMGVTDIFDPAQNIAGGTQYLAKMMELFGGDVQLALAGYNAGPEAVKRNGGIPPYQETQNYVVKVVNYWNALNGGTTTVVAKLTQGGNGKPSSGAKGGTQLAGNRFVVHFHSGLKQPADKVVDKEPYYYIDFGNRTYPVRKDLVREIVEPTA